MNTEHIMENAYYSEELNYISCVNKGSNLHIIFNNQTSSVNTLCSQTIFELSTIISNASMDKTIAAVVFESAKEGCFIAGADINEIKTISSQSDAYAKATMGQSILNKIAKLKVPTYAIINGACMGGGLELALACDFRIATTNPKTKLALPEVNLGFIPGFGGTQRLPRVVGLKNALDLILTGKAIDGKKAKKMKLVHELCHNNMAYEVLSIMQKDISRDPKAYVQKHKYQPSFIEKHFPNIIFSFAKKSVIKKTKGFYPAPLVAISVLNKTLKTKIEKGLEIEATEFSKLAFSDISKNLVTLFFTNEALKKEYSDKVEPIESSAIIGSGVMGGGIAFLLNSNGINVRMKDITLNAITLGFRQIGDYYKSLVKSHKITQSQAEINISRVTSTIQLNGMSACDIIIEAVVEDISVKHSVLQELERKIKKTAIIATNTSSLRVSEIAEPLLRKENVIGMHFFNPVNKMPLVEVVATEFSSHEAVSKVMQLARKCGKVAIPVGDCNGFVVNRILLPFMNETLFCLEECADIKQIDDILKEFGMPMGAFELADEIGLDVCYKVAKILHTAYGDRMKPSILLDTTFKTMRLLGKKSGEGFYKNGKVNSKITKKRIKKLSKNEILERTMLIMINEASRILEEGFIKNPHYLDMAIIMGAGFPAFRGGILKYADSIGTKIIHEKLVRLTEKNTRFEPSKLLSLLARSNAKFYDTFDL